VGGASAAMDQRGKISDPSELRLFLHWQSLEQENAGNSDSNFTRLGFLGRRDTHRIVSICVALHKEARVSIAAVTVISIFTAILLPM